MRKNKLESTGLILLGVLLLIITFLINWALTWIQQKGARS